MTVESLGNAIKFTSPEIGISKRPSLLGRAVKWLRAPNEIGSIQGARKAFAIFLAAALSLTIVGIIPVVLGALKWKKQVAAEEGKEFNKTSDIYQKLLHAMDKEKDTSPAVNDFGLHLMKIRSGNPERQSEIPALQQEQAESPRSLGGNDLDLERYDAYKFSTVEEEALLARQEQIVAVNPKHGKVSLAELRDHGLLPTNKMVLGDVSVYCSKIFMLDTHFVSIALIEKEGQLHPRLLYHSNSQGTWRVMPFATKKAKFAGMADIFGVKIVHYGKGNCEADTQLPIPLICALNQLPCTEAQSHPYEAGNIVKTFTIDPQPDFFEKVGFNQSIYLGEGTQQLQMMGKAPSPADIHMPDDVALHPDFSQAVADYKQTMPHYGEVAVKIFASKDKSLLYMFYEMEDGRAFLSTVECIKDVPINTYGVREKIIHIEGMDAPLLEYKHQIHPDYWPENCGKHLYQCGSSHYENNWNFVRELEIMKMYYSEQGRSVPERV